MNIYNDYIELVEKKKQLEKQITDMQIEIYNNFKKELDTKATGTFNFEKENYKIKIIKKENVTVDQDMADAIGLAFKKKYTFDKKAYKDLNDSQKASVDECLTVKPAKPSFSIERI